MTTTAQEKINCVAGSSLPTAQQYNQATANGWGGLHVVRAATDALAVAASTTTNAPAGLSGAELVGIYQGVYQPWGDLPGYAGLCPACTIVPMIPQPGSGTRNTFLADLQFFNGGVPVVLGANVRQGIEENDPSAITTLNSTDEPNAIVPFSGGRLNLWNKGYFHNPHTPFNNNPFPGGAVETVGVSQLLGAPPDGHVSYTDKRGLFISWRASDDNALPWANNSATTNWVKTLFLGTTSFLGRSITGSGPVNDSGATYAYQDCGINNSPPIAACANQVSGQSIGVGNQIGVFQPGNLTMVNLNRDTPITVNGPQGCTGTWTVSGTSDKPPYLPFFVGQEG